MSSTTAKVVKQMHRKELEAVVTRGEVQPNRPKVSITLPTALLMMVDAEAAENYVSRSAVIVVALREHFRQGE